ncbi:MAG TPA: ATP-binding protein [Methylomirabilota bacterium]|nr:ATP-binding protein [Methylomirabilota bacterium]
MQRPRIAIVGSNQERAEALREKFVEKGFSAALYTTANASTAFQRGSGPVLLILDSNDIPAEATSLARQAHEQGAKALLLNHLDGLDQLNRAVSSGADFSWPLEIADELPDRIELLFADSTGASESGLLKSLYLSASAISAREQSRLADPGDLSGRLAKAEAQIETMRREMDSFTYSVSHDLRAPLRAIEGFTRILTEDYSNQLDAEGQKFLSYVVANSQHLGRLIDDLLVYHRLGKAQLTPAPIEMAELFRDVIAEQRALEKKSPERTFHVEVPGLLPATGDRNLLRQAITQYVSNALKFTRGTKDTRLEVGSYTENNEHVYFLKDNGIGFDMQYANKLFQVFQKLQRQDEFEGNGIGLAMVDRIIKRHGGRVWAQAEPDQGATFFFSLPAA